MASSVNYMSTDDLWSSWHYWRKDAAYWRGRATDCRNRYGYVSRNISVNINTADMRALSCFRVLTNRRPGLLYSDASAMNAIEGRITHGYTRSNIKRDLRA